MKQVIIDCPDCDKGKIGDRDCPNCAGSGIVDERTGKLPKLVDFEPKGCGAALVLILCGALSYAYCL